VSSGCQLPVVVVVVVASGQCPVSSGGGGGQLAAGQLASGQRWWWFPVRPQGPWGVGVVGGGEAEARASCVSRVAARCSAAHCPLLKLQLKAQGVRQPPVLSPQSSVEAGLNVK
jgi:hypothetical protein